MQTEVLNISGMTCGGCTSEVTRALKAVSGVDDVNVSLSEGEATVNYDERQTSLDQLRLAVKSAGYGVAMQGDKIVVVGVSVQVATETICS